ncbi:NAD-dependent epimerase/dehydratase family protein, partial [Streptomyces sp. ID05-04B]|uniref:NAD-dependent epimerase/dehydratase family protein n=1 Tax=Streptomyces sp. ID05-04B TaxID=3028661 RepID=UPI0029C2063D
MPEVGALGRPDGADGSSGRVLVLGATGFVGRHVGVALERAGYEVLAGDGYGHGSLLNSNGQGDRC